MMRRPSIIRCLLAVTFITSIAFAGLAHAQTGPSLTLEQTAGPIGSKIDFSGTGCFPDPASTRSTGRFEVYTFVASLNQDKFAAGASFTSNADGSFSGKATVMDTAEVGTTYQSRVICKEGRADGPNFTVVGNSTTSTSTTTTAAPATTSSTVAAATPSTTSVSSTSTTVAAQPIATTAPSTTVVPTSTDDDTTTPVSADTTAPLSYVVQDTNTLPAGSLALTGADNLGLVLVALCFIFAAATVACFLNTPWFTRLEKVIWRLGEVIVDPFAPPTRR